MTKQEEDTIRRKCQDYGVFLVSEGMDPKVAAFRMALEAERQIAYEKRMEDRRKKKNRN